MTTTTLHPSPARRRPAGFWSSLPSWAGSIYASPHFWAIVIIVGVVTVGNLPYLLHLFDPNPLNTLSGLGAIQTPGLVPGSTAADPNVGFTAQALGHLSMVDWLHGQVPWWNPYEGLGSPLAGEMQAAAFFPPTVFLLLSNGQVLSHLSVELLAGLSTYFLLRRLSLGRAAAVAGGIAFGLNGTFSWFSHAPANPVAFLPLLLLGVEKAADTHPLRTASAWAIIGVALALSIYAGFPETTYIDGVLVGIWVIIRAIQLGSARRNFLLTIAKGLALGLVLAAPLLIAFIDYLPHAYVGAHNGAFGAISLPRGALSQSLLPYVYGSIDSFSPYDASGTLSLIWGSVGGYITFTLLTLAVIGLYGARFRSLRVALAAWAIVCFARTYGVQPFQHIVNTLPAMGDIAFFRYSDPSWEFAVIVLAALGLDDTVRGRVPRWWILLTSCVSLGLLGLIVSGARSEIDRLGAAAHHHAWALASIVWAFVTVAIVLVAALGFRGRLCALILVAVVSLDTVAMFSVPEFSAPRSATLDSAPVTFLQRHLGTYRFYSIGPIQPNYGSYFGLSSLNVNDLPVPKLWWTFVPKHLDPNGNPIFFNGSIRMDPQGSTALEEFARHATAFEQAGVKYLLVPPGTILPKFPPADLPQKVFSSQSAEIYQLPSASPIFTSSTGTCRITAETIQSAVVTCPHSEDLIRRELYMNGWSASVNGRSVGVAPYDSVYQEVEVPAGTSTVSFNFTPPHEVLGYVAFLLGLCCLVAVPTRRAFRRVLATRGIEPPRLDGEDDQQREIS